MLRRDVVFRMVALGFVPLGCLVLVAGCPVPTVPECVSDADCASGQVCENGVCADAPAPECDVDADCAEGHVCEESTCVEGLPEPPHKTRISNYEGTQTCLACHSNHAADIMETAHWNWGGAVDNIAGMEDQTHGKVDLINDY